MPEADGPVPHFINRHTFVCEVYTSEFKEYINPHPRQKYDLLQIVPDYQPSAYAGKTNGFYCHLQTKLIYLFYFVSLDSLKQKKFQTLTLNGKEFRDVYEIDVPNKEDWIGHARIKTFFWSKEHGYLKLVTNRDEQLILLQKYNDPKTIEEVRKSEGYKSDVIHNRVPKTIK